MNNNNPLPGVGLRDLRAGGSRLARTVRGVRELWYVVVTGATVVESVGNDPDAPDELKRAAQWLENTVGPILNSPGKSKRQRIKPPTVIQQIGDGGEQTLMPPLWISDP